ncbi:MAG TPA: glycine betaine ABC transporter substrate-binding protein [Anaerolineae bacterium]|nr:glycine betaine ABC transporter substrate-binding protein [Anaerolineae bacterium]
MKSNRQIQLWWWVGFCLLFVVGCQGGEEAGGETAVAPRPTIRLAERNWLGAQLNNAIAKILLEEELGYHVELVPVEGTKQFESLVQGETHANLEIWPSVWSEDMQYYIDETNSVERGNLLGVVGKVGWYVPTYLVAQQPELLTWEGLLQPEKASLFAGNEQETPVFLAGSRDWGQYDADIIHNLNLDFEVVFTGSEEALINEIRTAYRQQDPLLFYFWTPHPLLFELELTQVKLPEYSEACYANLEQDGVACDYPPDFLFKAYWPGLQDYAPEAYQLLQNIHYSNDDQIFMMGMVEMQGMLPEEAAQLWLDQNETKWYLWLPR